ncbi:type II toxin-antitoxin system VapC family toxin [Georgenia sp. Z1491]|uniref:type II toxin-antitoxin system VapC family toxin n=1 Tax=Georgenia sp. Z1491 TaxID=3416707 RepID=UPI003CEAF74C
MRERIFVDTAVLALAVGGHHPLREPCRALLHAAAAGDVELNISTEAIQELLFHRMRRGDRGVAVSLVRDVRTMCRVHAFDDTIVSRMLDLVAAGGVGGRDAVHAATALEQGFDAIVSPDRDLDGVPGLRRLDPGAAP